MIFRGTCLTEGHALILNIFNGHNYIENKFPLVRGTIMLPKSDVYISFIIILTILDILGIKMDLF